MDLHEANDGDIIILGPDGELGNPQECGILERKLNALIGGGARAVIVDCAAVTKMSAAAIRMLLLSQRRIGTAKGALVLCGLGEKIRRVFAISGFDRDFTIAVDRPEALARMAALTAGRAGPGAQPDSAGGRRLSKPAGPIKAPPVMPRIAEPVAVDDGWSRLEPLADLVTRALAAGEARQPPAPSVSAAGSTAAIAAAANRVTAALSLAPR